MCVCVCVGVCVCVCVDVPAAAAVSRVGTKNIFAKTSPHLDFSKMRNVYIMSYFARKINCFR